MMMMMVLVSKQQYKMQAKQHFTLFCQSGEDIFIQKCRASRFCCRESGFSSHWPQVAVGFWGLVWYVWCT